MHCDVLIVGGGPAGSTAAALLAERGYSVTLLEKARHPRFHIGESLLPANLPLFERLGVAEQVRAIGMRKEGAEFVSPDHELAQTFPFAEAWDKSMPFAYQVRRSQLDEILIRNAARKGAEVLEGCRARRVDFPENPGEPVGVHAETETGEMQLWQTRFVIDASGRDTLLGAQFKVKKRNPLHNSSALYGHFEGARRNPGQAEGNISIFWFEHGWFWFIPLAGGVTSIGAVTWPYYMKTRAQRSPEQFFLDTVAACPKLSERLSEARLVSEVHATGNYSYVCDRTHGERYLLLGDAYAFIDPVFSSGVMLAMHSAFAGAEAVATCLSRPELSKQALEQFDRVMRRGPRIFSWFIYRVSSPAMRELLMQPRNMFRVKEALLSVLAGDIFGNTPIWGSVFVFKCIYYLSFIVHWKSSFAAWRMRKNNIRPVELH
ncbi:NAD(P)/FAD-dependent oxidoreductase [Candidatus Methylospira mobilis]|uniref:NAD(P)/FAD-dependent oxidoreductase n=1 Tax=Candidatus Methylospira mobilis TaxID=1808979 RepID=A0A5Q0BGQ2_9GAMM|nr:NAD(P)/FAD-dependent oxidoreductase [Candidatus Methylospira mobilis]QFY41354.1 NAD(P)/FAD-dependent oxidoreductase [Candidatus Methylospira mobilis]WNV05421.1 NAD(P)/FAD-dependent oxidoreductase [Candidatus Methylospira mobilis]